MVIYEPLVFTPQVNKEVTNEVFWKNILPLKSVKRYDVINDDAEIPIVVIYIW